MANSMQLNLSVHRPWEYWANIILGLLTIVVPLVALKGAAAPLVYSGVIAGIVILAMTLFEAVNRHRIEEAVQFLAGVWLIVSAYFLNYGGMTQLRDTNIILGILVAILAIYEFWQDSARAAA